MKILWSWLKEYFEEGLFSPEEASSLLTRGGTETSVSLAHEWAKPFCVAEVIEVEPHPQANALSVCQVKDGQGQQRTVVCGASNVRKGLKTILALPGYALPGQKTPLEVTALRGVRSEGMLCSKEELALDDLDLSVWASSCEGIIEMDPKVSLGTSLQDLLGEEALLDLEITPNRGDLLSHLGVARELQALGAGRMRTLPLFQEIDVSRACANVQTAACRQVYFGAFEGVRQGRTPAWMRRRLAGLGLPTYFPCVDFTNYLAQDIGRPLHVFDAEEIEGPLTVRLSHAKEPFQALDGQMHTLPEGLVVVADQQGILALAGVMGGQRGRCRPESRQVILESADFSPEWIARAGQLTHLTSEARLRFERGIDPQLVKVGLWKAAAWIQEQCHGTLVRLEENISERPACAPIDFSLDEVARLSGAEISSSLIQQRLKAVGAEVTEKNAQQIEVRPPSWRSDWRLPADCVEEVLRLGGYEEIPSCPLQGAFISLTEQKETGRHLPALDYTTIWKARRFLVAGGLYESVTWSFVSLDQARLFSEGQSLEAMTLANPISQDLAVMRPSLLPHLIQIYTYHKNHALAFAPVFEIGPRFKEGQQETVALLFPMAQEYPWPLGRQEISFYKVKGIIENLLRTLDAAPWACEAGGPSWYHPGRCARLLQDGKEIAVMGQLHPRLKMPVWGAEIDLSRVKRMDKDASYSIPALQPVTKDFSFFLSSENPGGVLIQALKEAGRPDLIDLYLTDVFQDASGQRSLTLKAIFQPQSHTFAQEHLHKLMDRLIKKAQSQGATLRGVWDQGV